MGTTVRLLAVGVFVLWGLGIATLFDYPLDAASDASSVEPDALEVHLRFKEEKARLRKDVIAYVEFRNRGTRPMVVNLALTTIGDCGLAFDVVGPSGRSVSQNLIHPGRRLSPYGPKDFRKMEPGASYRLEIRINGWFELAEVGLYSFRVAYWNKYSGRWFDEPVWTGMTSKSRATIVQVVD